jgi:hypothetical protein
MPGQANVAVTTSSIAVEQSLLPVGEAYGVAKARLKIPPKAGMRGLTII